MIENSPGYQAIKRFYGDKRAKRSGVLLLDHIDQGIEILRRRGSDEVVMEAYAVHPIFQADQDLKENFYQCDDLHPLIVLYAMEYRNIANGFLSYKIKRRSIMGWGEPAEDCVWEAYPAHQIKLSPLAVVNDMLIADKVQNRKDFIRYHKGTHDRSLELDFYFNMWLETLGISADEYDRLVDGL